MRGLRFRVSLGAMLVGGLLAAPFVRAQAPSPSVLSPESAAILGTSESQKEGLDPSVVAVLGRPEGVKPDGRTAAQRASDIAQKLRCPVCQGVSIADSPSGMATKMRGQVRDLLAEGYSEEQVMSYFEHSYGEFVRLEPPLRGLNVLLWILPAAVLLGGAFFVFRMANRPLAVNPTPGTGGEVAPRAADVDPELAKYLERIRRDSGTSS